MYIVDEVLEVLKDGKRHNLSEITKRLTLTPKKTEEILHFLAECDLATFDQKNNTAIIDPELKNLILLEEQTTVSHRRKEQQLKEDN